MNRKKVPCPYCSLYVSARLSHQCVRCKVFMHTKCDNIHLPANFMDNQDIPKMCMKCKEFLDYAEQKRQEYHKKGFLIKSKFCFLILICFLVPDVPVKEIQICEFCGLKCNSCCENPKCKTICCKTEDGKHGTFTAGNFYCQNCAPDTFANVSIFNSSIQL